MSCSVSQILDTQTQGNIDDGVANLAAQIKKNVNFKNQDCNDSKLDKAVAFASIAMQYLVFAFILIALVRRDESTDTLVKVIVITSIATTALLVIQYRDVLLAAIRILGALDTSTKVILALSVLATLGTGYIQDGGAGLYLTMGIAAVLFLRLSLQVKDFIRDTKSPVPAFTKFMKELITPSRIQTLYNAFK
ncbi:hypothetical protein ATCVCanal1_714L [Acanthocystis turfacea Chlorella virus Canal-1]|nr:hypothetical protein ATCVCanal1_714L [Acanthocystis turfacea Chlorella virus Canal-1]